MSDVSYTYFKQQLLNGANNLAGLNLKLCLVRIGGGHYVVSPSSDQFLSAIAVGDRVAISPVLTTVTVTNGIFNAGNTVFAAVPAGPAAGALVLFIDTGNPATSQLIAYFDSYSGLPVTPSGADINVSFNTGANKIFALIG